MSKIDTTLDRVFEKLGTDLRVGLDRGLFKSENFDSYLMGRLRGNILNVSGTLVVNPQREDALSEVLDDAKDSVREEIKDFLDEESVAPTKFDILEASILVETVDAELDEDGSVVVEDIRYAIVFTVYAE